MIPLDVMIHCFTEGLDFCLVFRKMKTEVGAAFLFEEPFFGEFEILEGLDEDGLTFTAEASTKGE